MLKNMYYKKLLLIVLVLFLFVGELLAIKMPEKAQGMPKVFDDETKSYTWESIAEKRNWGDFSNNPWLVYVVNDGTIAYDSTSSASRQLMNLDFMEDYYVAQLSGDYALLFYLKGRMNGLDIPSSCGKQCVKNAKGYRNDGYVGWVKIDDLLLWHKCPRTKEGVYKKIAIVKNIDDPNMSKERLNSVPILYNTESCSSDTVGKVGAYEFYFLFKNSKTENAALVYQQYKINESSPMTGEKIGWIAGLEYIPWNTRICWEVAFDDGDNEKLNDSARTFVDDESAFKYDIRKQRTGTKITGIRKDPKIPRSPILDYDYENGVSQMSVIASSGRNGYSDEENLKIHKKIEELEKSLSSINIVFVMDATRSMERSFYEMRKALKEVSMERYNNKLTIKYGAVLFRNYEDAPKDTIIDKLRGCKKSDGRILYGDLCEIKPLTTDANVICNFLDEAKCKSVSDNVQEAMFYGLDKAADLFKNPNESNFIILVSDVSSEVRSKYTKDDVIRKLSQKKVNLVAFQSAWNSKYGYDFGPQVKEVIRGLLKADEYGEHKESRDGVTYYVQEDEWPLRPMAYRIAQEQSTSSYVLYNFAKNIIEDFIHETDNNILRLKSSLGGTDNEVDKSVCKALIKKGYITKCEDLQSPIKVQGYSKMWYRFIDAADRRMFLPCLFMADRELSELILDLEQVTNRSSEKDIREELQEQCIKMIFLYTAQEKIANKDKYAMGKQGLLNTIKSIENECGYIFDYDVKQHIYDRDKLSDDDRDRIINRLKGDVLRLKAVQNDPNSCVRQDGVTYYYILLRDMPFIQKQK